MKAKELLGNDFANMSYHDFRSIGRLREQGQSDPKKALEIAARELESFFLQTLLKQMRSTNKLIGGEESLFSSQQMEFFQAMQDEQLASDLARGQSMGLADIIVKQLAPFVKSNASSEPQSANAAAAKSVRPRSADNKEAPSHISAQATAQARSEPVTEHQKAYVPIVNFFADAEGNRNNQLKKLLNLPMIGADGVSFSPLAPSATSSSSSAASQESRQLPIFAPLKRSNSASSGASQKSQESSQTRSESTNARSTAIHAPDLSFDSPKAFLQSLLPYAKRAAELIGTDPRVLLAQAALETGWGRAIAKDPQGKSSFNLFGIKADSRWSGAKVSSPTLEFVDGLPIKEVHNFRAYSDWLESFMDYAQVITGSERYQSAIKNASDAEAYTQALQDAGYATDPQYATKIMRILRSNLLRSLNTAE